MRALIAATPRSGTSYITKVLHAVGVEAGHEAVFRQTGFQGWAGYEVEVSGWWFGDEPDPPAVVVHQIRHPLHTIGSLVATGVVADIKGNLDKSTVLVLLTFCCLAGCQNQPEPYKF